MAEPDISPETLKFRFQLNKQLLSTININNPSDKRLAFKIKTTAPKKYVVRPSSGVCDPKSNIAVQVIMQAQKEYPVDFQNCKDKFMVQTTQLGDDDQLDKDTFDKEKRQGLKETRLRVALEGPAAPPSPVPEANETETEDSLAKSAAAAGAADQRGDLGASPDTRAKAAMADAAYSTAQVNAMQLQLDRVTKERDDLRKRVDILDLQGAQPQAAAAAPRDPAVKFRVTIIHIILVAILAFIIGHYT